MRPAAVCVLLAASLLVSAGRPAPAFAQDNTSALPVDGIIVKFRAGAAQFRKRALSNADIAELSEAAAAAIASSRAMSGNRHLLRLQPKLSRFDAEAAAARLAQNSGIDYAVPDYRKFPQRTPNDELYAFQWNYTDPVAGINAPAAWDITTGASTAVVAVADTGSRPHPDAAQGLSGYNFISDPFTANNGVGRGPSPIDTGDGVTPEDAMAHPELSVTPSSWHGEFVAGLIGAMTDNGIGIAGVNWNASLFHVRVLGVGGGADSDILDGINWAAGFPVPGVPDNPHPTQVINMSLGGAGPCGADYQDTFDAIAAAGITIIVAAGNNDADVANTSPANCTGPIVTVAATGNTGAKASYSNYGTVPNAITLAAPGGDGAYAGTILSLSNTGEYAPVDESYEWKAGTSSAAAEVSGVVALMLSVDPMLTPPQVVRILRDTARAFPAGTGNDCNPVRCGAGIVDAHAAVSFAQQLAAPATVPATGFWYAPSERGIGFAIEQQGGNLFMASALFDVSGRATWYASGSGATSGAGYLGTLTIYGGGPTLFGAYTPASVTGSYDDLALNFSSTTQGSLTWPGGTIAIERLNFGPGGAAAAQPAGTPEAGWWWAPSESGRGYAFEIQGNMMLLIGYMYDAAGNPIWYSSGPAPMTSATTYQGVWQQFAFGPTLTGNAQAPQLFNAMVGAVTIQFDTSASATLTLPDSRQIQIVRFRF